jgi:hypothetical protein
VTEWFREQQKFSDGEQYFESLAKRESSPAPVVSRHALPNKALLQNDEGRNTLDAWLFSEEECGNLLIVIPGSPSYD